MPCDICKKPLEVKIFGATENICPHCGARHVQYLGYWLEEKKAKERYSKGVFTNNKTPERKNDLYVCHSLT